MLDLQSKKKKKFFTEAFQVSIPLKKNKNL